MADRKISDLTALTTPASGDFLPIVDISEVAAASKNKRITIQSLFQGIPVNVGIGTAAPLGTLHLKHATDANIFFRNSTAAGLATGTLVDCFNDAASTATPLFARASQFVFGADSGGTFVERARIDSSGRLLVGTSSALLLGSALANYAVNIETLVGGGVLNHCIGATRHGGTVPEAGQRLTLARSRGTTIGSVTLVANNDQLGALDFAGADGTDFGTTAAQIVCEVDGTPGSNDMPGRLVFSVTADGAASPTEALRISNDRSITVSDGGNVVLGTTTGTKIGTATTQKISLWNATPVVQPAAVANITTTATAGALPTPDGAVTIANTATPTVTELLEYCVELEDKLEDLLGKLRTVGIIAT